MTATRFPRGILAAAGMLVLTACGDGFFQEPAAAGDARVTITALQIADGATLAFEKADRLQVAVTARDDGRTLYAGSIPVNPGGGPIEAVLDVELSGRPVDASLSVAVRRDADDLFLSEADLSLVPGEDSPVSLTLRPVPRSLGLSELPTFTTYGQVLPLEGAVLFATGDPIPAAAPEWESLTPDVLRVESAPGGGFQAVAVADGVGSLRARYASTTGLLDAPVRAVVVSAEVVPGSTDVALGRTVDLDAVSYDAADNLVPGRTTEWTSSDPSVASVDGDGLVTGLAEGSADIVALTEGVTALATVRVRDFSPGVSGVGTRSPTPTGITLVGRVDPRGFPTTTWFEYGRDPALADAVPTPTTALSGSTPLDVLHALDALLPGTTYFFRVVAENPMGRTESPVFAFTTPGGAGLPQAPSGLSAARVLGGGVRLAWVDNSTTETRFEIERADGAGAAIVAEVNPDVTFWLDPSPPVDVLAYRVRACNDAGCSAWTSAALPPPPPEWRGPVLTTLVPTQFVVVGAARLRALVDARGAPTSVWFEYGTDAGLTGASTTPIQTIDGTGGEVELFTSVSGLFPGVTYYTRGVASNGNGRSEGAILSFVAVGLPAVPGNLQGAFDGSGGVLLTWLDTSDDEVRFEIERRAPATNQTALFRAAANAEQFADTAPPAGDLLYRVRSCSPLGCSLFTDWIQIVPPPSAPTGLSITFDGANGLILGWVDNSTDEAGFELERRLIGGSGPSVVGLGADAVSYADTAPPAGLLEYRVRACKAGGCSPWSTPAQSWYGLAPVVTLAPATNIALTSADLNADVTALQAPTTVVFRISTDPGFATSTVVPTPALDAGSGASPIPVTTSVVGLEDGSTYYVRAEATNLWGTTVSTVASFTTTGGSGDGSQ